MFKDAKEVLTVAVNIKEIVLKNNQVLRKTVLIGI